MVLKLIYWNQSFLASPGGYSRIQAFYKSLIWGAVSHCISSAVQPYYSITIPHCEVLSNLTLALLKLLSKSFSRVVCDSSGVCLLWSGDNAPFASTFAPACVCCGQLTNAPHPSRASERDGPFIDFMRRIWAPKIIWAAQPVHQVEYLSWRWSLFYSNRNFYAFSTFSAVLTLFFHSKYRNIDSWNQQN